MYETKFMTLTMLTMDTKNHIILYFHDKDWIQVHTLTPTQTLTHHSHTPFHVWIYGADIKNCCGAPFGTTMP